MLAYIKHAIPEESYSTWFANTSLERLDEETVEIGVASLFIKEWLRDNYLQVLQQAFKSELGVEPEIRFRISGPSLRALRKAQEDAASEGPTTAIVGPPRKARRNGQLNAQLRLDSFVSGAANRIVRAACERAAQSPGHYNPLVIHGGHGLGKTHLLHGICHAAEKTDGARVVVYSTFEEFTHSFMRTVAAGKKSSFREQYRGCDLLVLDDLQFLAQGKKEKTQQEFVALFEELLHRNAQIVVSADRNPRLIEGLIPSLSHRLITGLTLALEPPELEARIAIAQQKAAVRKLYLPEEIAAFIATRAGQCPREIEGAVNRLAAQVELGEVDLSLNVVRECLQAIVMDDVSSLAPPSMQAVAEAVAEVFAVRTADVLGRKRSGQLPRARAVAFLLSREVSGESFSNIGRFFGKRSHATVLSAIRQLREATAEDGQLAARVDRLRQRLGGPEQGRLL